MKNSKTIDRIGILESTYIQQVLSSQFRSSSGAQFMTRLENEFAKRFGTKFAISLVNGTATMHAALEAAGIGEGDEVIVPPLTMSSTSLAVLHANATPVFADIDPESWVIDPKSIEAKITARTKAIIPVALYGLSADLPKIVELAKTHNLMVIEDNAEAFLSYINDKLVGTFGTCSSFSFQSSKHLTSGEGGIVLTDDESLAVNIRKASGLGYTTLNARKAKIGREEIQNPNFLRHDFLGWNYRMPELCCAVALAQLERIDELVGARIEAAKQFDDAILASDSKILQPQQIPKGYKSSFWTYACLLETSVVSWKGFRECFLKNGGDPFYAAWQLSYLEPLFQNRKFGARDSMIQGQFESGICPVAEKVQPRIIQFKTNYWSSEESKTQAEILFKTLNSLNKL